MMKLYVIIFVMVIGVNANNITVSNVTLVNQNTSTNTVEIQFNISWENSWRVSSAPNNYDAAWIFVKYKDSTNEWKHATLSSSSGDHTPVSGTAIDAVSDGKGVFLYRSGNGSGTFISSGNSILWDYGTDGLNDASLVTIKVFAIEMVNIPQGSFYAGSDTSNVGDVNSLFVGGASANPFQITTSLVGDIQSKGEGISDSQDDNVLKAINGNTGIGIDGDGGIDNDNDGEIDNASFPTGYNAFYMMKYEVSQAQFVEFLNTLTRTQQELHTARQTAGSYAMTDNGSLRYRNCIRVPSSVGSGVITFGCDYDGDGTFDESTDGTGIACNFINWVDITAYLDWAAIRPATELEFVKAARGPSAPSAGEYTWGDLTISAGTGPSYSGQENEIASNASSNANYSSGGIGGPLRTGCFAQSSTTRSQAGAGYYGVMDLSGNLWEELIPLGTANGRAFTGGHGDGELSGTGYCDISNWYPTSGTRVGQRGGLWAGSVDECRIANRNYAARQSYSRREYDGFRGVRTSL